jgi:hypothetical protein
VQLDIKGGWRRRRRRWIAGEGEGGGTVYPENKIRHVKLILIFRDEN